MTEKDLLEMELHETKGIRGGNDFIYVLRVPGGWIYTARQFGTLQFQ